MYLRALKDIKKELRPNHTSTFDTAEKTYLRVLESKEKAFRSDHISTLNIINNLDNLYTQQGKLVEAEKIYLRALEGYEKTLVPNNISTPLGTVNNLGSLYSKQGTLAEAEKIFIRALEDSDKALGPYHTSILSTINDLGNLHFKQGKLAEAEKIYPRVLKSYENTFSPEVASSYPPALTTMLYLGDTFSQTDRKNIAQQIYNQALSGYTIFKGPSSKWSRQIEERLQALQIVPAASNIIENEFPVSEIASSKSVKRKSVDYEGG
ncbi:uncharacterized protein EAF02_003409 [Botrytis sinoallii]|uniref:uncharacterized protein n=1 Tax=Botrytis sinoallii TaxID=1463999 RepID=UPI0018FFE070|nr:uncharacterized protein EAF02_003409 [Botrytis sinoallii]KAF7886762.1 hypothetical protein EAF02_003409 [Botrytis sinoallii]